jgi:hypothetical protein
MFSVLDNGSEVVVAVKTDAVLPAHFLAILKSTWCIPATFQSSTVIETGYRFTSPGAVTGIVLVDDHVGGAQNAFSVNNLIAKMAYDNVVYRWLDPADVEGAYGLGGYEQQMNAVSINNATSNDLPAICNPVDSVGNNKTAQSVWDALSASLTAATDSAGKVRRSLYEQMFSQDPARFAYATSEVLDYAFAATQIITAGDSIKYTGGVYPTTEITSIELPLVAALADPEGQFSSTKNSTGAAINITVGLKNLVDSVTGLVPTAFTWKLVNLTALTETALVTSEGESAMLSIGVDEEFAIVSTADASLSTASFMLNIVSTLNPHVADPTVAVPMTFKAGDQIRFLTKFDFTSATFTDGPSSKSVTDTDYIKTNSILPIDLPALGVKPDSRVVEFRCTLA